MSAILVSKTDTAIELLADGAMYTNDGVVLEIKRKIRVWPEHGVAASVRGNGAFGDYVMVALGAFLSGHDLYGAITALSSALSEQAEEIAQGDAIELTIAGWQGDHPVTCYMVTRQMGDYAPLTFYYIPSRFQGGAMGSPDPESWKALGVSDDAPDDTLRANGVRIMEALRHLPGPVFGREDQGAVYGIGGHVQYVRLEPDGHVEDVILKEWPDKPGEKIRAA